MSLQINDWNDAGWPADCDTGLNLVAIPANQDCILPPKLSQICDLYITPDGADEPFVWTLAVPAANAVGIDNTVTDNSKSKQLTVKGGIGEPEEEEYAGAKRQTVITERTYTLTLEVSVVEDAMRNFVRQFESGWTGFKFWYANLGGGLFGPEAGIRPSSTNGRLPLDEADNGKETGTIIIQFISEEGSPIRNPNPYA